MTQIQDPAKTIIHIDIGTVNTRVCLFEFTGGQYTFVGAASAGTTNHETGASEYAGVIEAVKKLELAIKRKFLDRNADFVIPAKLDRTGVDQVSLSYTCAGSQRIALMGLTREGSLRNLRALAEQFGIQPAAEICAMDGNDITANLDTLLNADPRLVLFAGGTESGAEKAVYRLAEVLLFACKSLPREQRPEILFLNSSNGRKQIEKVFSKIAENSFAPNILEAGSGGTAGLNTFVTALRKIAENQSPGLKELRERASAAVIPGEFAFGRSIRLMSRLMKENQYVLGIDIGADHTIVASALNLELNMNVLPLGTGRKIQNLLRHFTLSELQSWIGFQIKETEVQDYICNKSVYPDLVPANHFSAQIEQALTRFILRRSAETAGIAEVLSSGKLGYVLLCGAVMRNVEDPGDALLMGMDGLHPAGIVDYGLDMNGLAAAIGSLAHQNPQLTSHIMNASTFLNLGKVVTPALTQDALKVKEGKKLMVVSIRDDGGNVRKYEIPRGRIFRIPLDYGRNYEMDWVSVPKGIQIPGARIWTPLGFKSGCFGIVFDTRGEKIRLPQDRTSQIGRLKYWREELGPWVSQ